jgi:hypothetical protein
VDRRTERHLQTAERNRLIALAHLSAQPAAVRPPAFEWVAVIAFYAAVHYVNAYLWEIRRYMPPDHDSRNRLLNGDAVLRSCRGEYSRLFDVGFKARYQPGFRLSEEGVRELLDEDLETVRRTVRTALGLSPSR